MSSRKLRTLITAALAAAGLLAAAPAGSAAVAGATSSGAVSCSGTSTGAASVAGTSGTHYDHVFVIVEENHGYSDVIGNPAAPNLNALAKEYGSATNYYAVAHPSEPNYVALLGGSTLAVNSDNPYYVNRVAAPSLISQLDHAGISWKAYLQGLPHPGYQGICYPASCNGAPDKDPLYVSKHNPIPNFTTSLNAADWSRQVPVEQLTGDLRGGKVPAFSLLVPDECHDQHGDPPYCVDSGSPGGGDPQDQHLVATGDRYLGQVVSQITNAAFWAKGNNAIDVVYDEGNDNAGGGGKVANIVVTSHGPRHLQDPAPYSHYSLLSTIQRNFGLGCLQNTCDTAHVRPFGPLLTVNGSAARPFTALPVPAVTTPTPTPAEPVSRVTSTPSSAGWSVQGAPIIGKGDNTFGSVAAVSPTDVWAVGNYLPDAAGSNKDATLSMAAHYDGTRWTSTPTPNSGPNFNTLFGAAATPGRAWAVGVALDSQYQAHSLVEAWNGSAWKIAATPKLNTQRDILYSATAVSASDVWAVGEQQDRGGRFGTLIEHWNGTRWSAVPSPDPGSTGNQLYGVAAAGPDNVWAVGQRNDATTDRPLVEHWDGRHWHTVAVPSAATTGAVLQAVTVHGNDVWAVGVSDEAAQQGRPLVEHLTRGSWHAELPAGIGSDFTDLTGVAVTGGAVTAVGTYYDAAAGRQLSLIARNDGHGWQPVAAPDPGTGDTVFGAISAAGDSAWAVGYAKTDTGRSPLIEFHRAH
ncbi:alkaline phosphatase family protein [Actinacidiphila oryziradicis]|uniref:alkaline phosphatase family protein n=1 Tax=Actinacidiphila oryziradicis TaxID=2571141 RepID=UPI0023F24B1B|nr:alkaline phosphatase family protein [Actinacidiphila oryziradicis]MCW2869735.1 Phosphoesterase family protein [Actinacidiphila oryziradicis]